MRTARTTGAMTLLAAVTTGCASGPGATSSSSTGPSTGAPSTPSIVGVWGLVEFRDFDVDGGEVESLGNDAPGVFIHTPDGHLSLHIMTDRERPLIDRDTTDEERGRIERPYIGYFGTYTVDRERMVVIHHIEGAKVPNRVGRSAARTYRFEDGDLILDFESPGGRRYDRRLARVERF